MLRAYLDTSVFSALLDERAPERQLLTRELWARHAELELASCDLTREELAATPGLARRVDLLHLLDEVTVFPVTPEMRDLAARYVAVGAFAAAYFADALHVAAAVLTRQDVLVSWNFRHLVNRKRRAVVAQANVSAGLPQLDIVAPPEV